MRLNLITMTDPPQEELLALRRVIPYPEFGGVQHDPQDLRIGDGGPAGKEVEHEKHDQTTHETAEEVEGGGSNDHREKKQPPLGAPNGERFVDRSVDRIESWVSRHGLYSGAPQPVTEKARP